MKKRKVLVLTGGGDCPGLNAVIRGIVKRASHEENWEVLGSIEAFNGVLNEPTDLIKLTKKKVAGIHVKGGTILKTTNKGINKLKIENIPRTKIAIINELKKLKLRLAIVISFWF